MSLENFSKFRPFVRPLLFSVVIALHAAALICIRFTVKNSVVEEEPQAEIFKLVDVEEFIPPPPPVIEKKEVVVNQVKTSENIQVTDKEVIEIPEDIEYIPQHKISVVPEIPTKKILSRIEYPKMAMKQGIEGVVYLELFIDEAGNIRRINVLKDPGYGFADAAVAALEGIVCKPALVNEHPVAVRFRYPVKFVLKQ